MKKFRDCRGEFPGPGQYPIPSTIGCKATNITTWKAPCYSFGLKTKGQLPKKSPGPADYTYPTQTRFGRITIPTAPMSAKLPLLKRFMGPGPGKYSPEKNLNVDLTRAPIYSFGRKLPLLSKFATPAPNAYSVVNANVYGKRQPAFSLVSRRAPVKGLMTPAPNAYGIPSTKLVTKRSPQYSLYARRPSLKKSLTPGPGAYSPNFSNLPKVPGFRFTSLPNPCVKPFIQPYDNEYEGGGEDPCC